MCNYIYHKNEKERTGLSNDHPTRNFNHWPLIRWRTCLFKVYQIRQRQRNPISNFQLLYNEFQEQSEEDRKKKFEVEDKSLDDAMQAEATKTKGRFFSNWGEKRQQRLDKIKQSKERPSAPLLEELQEKPGYKEIKLRKLIQRNEEGMAKDAAKDDYI